MERHFLEVFWYSNSISLHKHLLISMLYSALKPQSVSSSSSSSGIIKQSYSTLSNSYPLKHFSHCMGSGPVHAAQFMLHGSHSWELKSKN